MIPVQQLNPHYGVSFDAGWIGFTCYPKELVSIAIAGMEAPERHGLPSVTHTFIVEGPLTGIEAHAQSGVARFDLAKYLIDPACRVYFRRPSHLDDDLADLIVRAACQKLGCSYNLALIGGDAAAKTPLGRLLNRLFHDWPKRLVNWCLDDPKKFICSELVAVCLASQSEYRGQGILGLEPANCIDPQELFGDTVLFEPFINDCSMFATPAANGSAVLAGRSIVPAENPPGVAPPQSSTNPIIQ